MIVRATLGRGLTYQTHTFWKHLKPEVTVVIDMSLAENQDRWPQDLDAYPGGIVTQWRGYATPFLNRDALDALAECDVVYSAETYYDERLPALTNTVLHVNPELFRGDPATAYWYPTAWRTAQLPEGPFVGTPIEDDRIANSTPDSSLLLHVGGHRATGDRNGTNIIGGIFRHVPQPWRVTTQDGMRINPRMLGHVEVVEGPEDHWELYDGAGILVYPRRYGGQSLQVNEAMARGLVVVMPDCEPNPTTWPIIPIRSRPSGFAATPGGRIQMHMIQTQPLIDTLHRLINDEDQRRFHQQRSLTWANAHKWSVKLPELHKLLDHAAS